MLDAHLERPLYEGEVRVVRHDRLAESGKLYALPAKLDDFPDDLVHRAFPAVKYGAHLYGGGFCGDHRPIPSLLPGFLSSERFDRSGWRQGVVFAKNLALSFPTPLAHGTFSSVN